VYNLYLQHNNCKMYKLGDFELVLMHLVIAVDWKDTNIPLACH